MTGRAKEGNGVVLLYCARSMIVNRKEMLARPMKRSCVGSFSDVSGWQVHLEFRTALPACSHPPHYPGPKSTNPTQQVWLSPPFRPRLSFLSHSPHTLGASRPHHFHIPGLAKIIMAAYYASDSVLTHATSLYPYGQLDDPDSQAQTSTIYNLPTDSEGEAEVDELESDTGSEQGAGASAAQKKAGKRMGERVPGTTLLPISKIENIVQADGVFPPLVIKTDAVDALSPLLFKASQRISPCRKRLPLSYPLQRYVSPLFFCDSGVYTTLGGIYKTYGPSRTSTSFCFSSEHPQLRGHGSAWRRRYTALSLIAF